VHTNLSFLALLFAFTNPLLSGFLFAIAIGTKLQAIIFLPILVVIWLYSTRNIKTFIGLLLVIFSTLFMICLPFILAGSFGQLWQVVTGAVGKYPVISIGAFNIWYLITSGDLGSTLDSGSYFVLSYKQTGLLLFFIASTIILLPMLFRMLRLRLSNAPITDDTQKLLMLTGGLIALCFYYFNTQMHERYASPIIIFFFFYAVFSKNYILYILASISYFLTLDKCFPDYLPIVHYKIIFASKVIAIWYTITLAYAFYEFLRLYKVRNEWRLLKESLKQV
jgi:Gpi18-like mannosyltransferase